MGLSLQVTLPAELELVDGSATGSQRMGWWCCERDDQIGLWLQ